MDKNLEREQKPKIDIETKSSASTDGRTFYTRLALPDTGRNGSLIAYFESQIHRDQIDLLAEILRG